MNQFDLAILRSVLESPFANPISLVLGDLQKQYPGDWKLFVVALMDAMEADDAGLLYDTEPDTTSD